MSITPYEALDAVTITAEFPSTKGDGMLFWLNDQATLIFFLIAVVSAGLLIAWWLRRERRYLVALTAMAVLALVQWLVGFLVVSDREQLVLHVRDLADSVQQHQAERAFAHLASDFRYQGLDRQAFIARYRRWVESGMVQEVVVWDENVEDVSRDSQTGTILFLVRVRGEAIGTHLYRCRATFRREDEQWKLSGFELLDPFTHEPRRTP